MCSLHDKYKGPESTSPTEECKAACSQVPSCIAIGTHYYCDRLYFSSYAAGSAEVPADMCKSWSYQENDGPVACNDIDADDCGDGTPTNGCWVKRVPTTTTAIRKSYNYLFK